MRCRHSADRAGGAADIAMDMMDNASALPTCPQQQKTALRNWTKITHTTSRRGILILAAAASQCSTAGHPVEMGADPIATGLVQTLNRLGGNITSVTSLNVQVTPKRLEILHEAVPAASAIAVLLNPTSPTANSQLRNLQPAVSALAVRLQILHASSERDFDAVSAALSQLRPGGLVVSSIAPSPTDIFVGHF